MLSKEWQKIIDDALESTREFYAKMDKQVEEYEQKTGKPFITMKKSK